LHGLRGAGVMGVMKHFPGHGATADDSHLMLPTVERELADLVGIDLLPYQQAIQAGELDAVMIGHLFVPAIDSQLPSTLSPATILGLLRDRLGFGGVVVTDELKMRAISAHYGVERAALLAVQAGVDVILADYTGSEQDAVFNTLVRACIAGDLAPGRIDQSAARILRAKRAYGLAGPQLEARLGAHLAALSVPAAAPATPAPDTSSEGTVGMTPDQEGQEGLTPSMPAEAGQPEGEQPADDAAVTPAPTTPTAAATSVSTQPTPTPVSPQPTPTPLRTATATASPTATASRTATRTATATRR
jgi:beta-glucosidase-like glycosyl hydrolase